MLTSKAHLMRPNFVRNMTHIDLNDRKVEVEKIGWAAAFCTRYWLMSDLKTAPLYCMNGRISSSVLGRPRPEFCMRLSLVCHGICESRNFFLTLRSNSTTHLTYAALFLSCGKHPTVGQSPLSRKQSWYVHRRIKEMQSCSVVFFF